MGILDKKSFSNGYFYYTKSKELIGDIPVAKYDAYYGLDKNNDSVKEIYDLDLRDYIVRNYKPNTMYSLNTLIEAKKSSMVRGFLFNLGYLNEYDREYLNEIGFKEQDLNLGLRANIFGKKTCSDLKKRFDIDYLWELLLIDPYYIERLYGYGKTKVDIINDKLGLYGYHLKGYPLSNKENNNKGLSNNHKIISKRNISIDEEKVASNESNKDDKKSGLLDKKSFSNGYVMSSNYHTFYTLNPKKNKDIKLQLDKETKYRPISIEYGFKDDIVYSINSLINIEFLDLDKDRNKILDMRKYTDYRYEQEHIREFLFELGYLNESDRLALIRRGFKEEDLNITVERNQFEPGGAGTRVFRVLRNIAHCKYLWQAALLTEQYLLSLPYAVGQGIVDKINDYLGKYGYHLADREFSTNVEISISTDESNKNSTEELEEIHKIVSEREAYIKKIEESNKIIEESNRKIFELDQKLNKLKTGKKGNI